METCVCFVFCMPFCTVYKTQNSVALRRFGFDFLSPYLFTRISRIYWYERVYVAGTTETECMSSNSSSVPLASNVRVEDIVSWRWHNHLKGKKPSRGDLMMMKCRYIIVAQPHGKERKGRMRSHLSRWHNHGMDNMYSTAADGSVIPCSGATTRKRKERRNALVFVEMALPPGCGTEKRRVSSRTLCHSLGRIVTSRFFRCCSRV